MTFRSAFHTLTYATALWAFLALVATGQLHFPVIVLFLAGLVIAITRSRTGFSLPHWLWIVLSLAMFLLAIWGFQNFDRLYSVTYFFLYLELNKLMTARKNRDYFQIYALTFFQILAASVSTESVVFAPMLAVYVFLIIAAMMTFTIKRDAEAALSVMETKRGDPSAPIRLPNEDAALLRRMAESSYWNRRMSAWMASLLVIVLVLGTVIFWVVPRSPRSSFLPGLGGDLTAPRTSGYADEINFGGMGEIQSDPTIIMRAIPYPEYLATRPEFLRIRGTSLDTFTGRQWNRAPSARGDVSTAQASAFTFPTERLGGHVGGRVFRARITLEPESSGYIFTIDQPLGVRLGEMRHLEVDSERLAVKNARPRFNPMSYDVTGILPADIGRVEEELFDEEMEEEGFEDPMELVRASVELVNMARRQIEPNIVRRPGRGADNAANPVYLSVPNLPDMQVIADMADEWAEGFTTDRSIAEEFERRFKSEFGYSLDVTFSNREDHISYFLTQSRSAHCEYFATAMALMLRSQGIPARIVNGYLTDEWSTTGRRYIVRQEHAHSWVEAQLDGSERWITFDPTPAAGVGSNRIPSTLYRTLSTWIDNIKTVWYDNFIDYTLDDQRESLIAMFSFLRETRRQADSALGSISGFMSGRDGDGAVGRRIVGGIFLVVGIGGLVGIGWWYVRQRHREAEGEHAAGSAFDAEKVRPFLDLLRELERVAPRPPAQTALEYADMLAMRHPGKLDELPELTRAYYGVRFNGGTWNDEMTATSERLRLALAEAAPSADKGAPARA